jgi:hypothetical protein
MYLRRNARTATEQKVICSMAEGVVIVSMTAVIILFQCSRRSAVSKTRRQIWWRVWRCQITEERGLYLRAVHHMIKMEYGHRDVEFLLGRSYWLRGNKYRCSSQ